jgi:hypothetical protein
MPIRQFLFFREHPEKIIDAFEQIEKKTNIFNKAKKLFQKSTNQNQIIDGIIDESMTILKKINNKEIVIDTAVKRINNNHDYIKYKEYLEVCSVILIEEDNDKYKIDFPNDNFNNSFYKNIFKNINIFSRKISKNNKDIKTNLDLLFKIENEISQLIISMLNKKHILNEFEKIKTKNINNIEEFIKTELSLQKILNNINYENIKNLKRVEINNKTLKNLEIKISEEISKNKNLNNKKFLEDHKNILGIKYVLILEKTKSKSFFSKNNIIKRNLIKYEGGGGHENIVSWQGFQLLGGPFIMAIFLFVSIGLCLAFGIVCLPVAVVGIFTSYTIYRAKTFDNFKSRLTLGIPSTLTKSMISITSRISNGVYFRIKLRNLIQTLKELHIPNPAGILGMNHRSKIVRNKTKRVDEEVFNE